MHLDSLNYGVQELRESVLVFAGYLPHILRSVPKDERRHTRRCLEPLTVLPTAGQEHVVAVPSWLGCRDCSSHLFLGGGGHGLMCYYFPKDRQGQTSPQRGASLASGESLNKTTALPTWLGGED